MTKSMIRISVVIPCLLLALLFVAAPVYAQSISVSPILIDKDLEPREAASENVTIKNNTESKLIVFATVNEIEVDSAGALKEFISPSMTDRTNTVTSWVEVTRGRIELYPGEERKVSVTVRTHPQAESGVYHAFVGFVPASNRPEAEAIAMRGDAEGAILKVTIDENSNDLLRIAGFFIERFVINEEKRNIEVEIENQGGTNVVPNGEIIFYNSRGEEMSSLKVNEAGEAIPAGEIKTFSLRVPLENKIGRFKANLRVTYGQNQQAAVFDTVQFFMVPWQLVIALFLAILIFSVIVTYLIRRAFYSELHDEEESTVPLYVRNDREHTSKDHDIHLTK